MPDAESPTPFRATLISTPWALFNRPSLQLAALKAYLEREMDAEIETCHPYLDLAAAIGSDTYRRISEAGWAGEALFAPLVFPERRQQAAKVFRQSLRKTAGSRRIPDFDGLVRRIDETCRDWLAGHDFAETRLIGFSVCFNQLLPSLYLAGLIDETGRWAGDRLRRFVLRRRDRSVPAQEFPPDRLCHRRRRGTAAPRVVRLSWRKK